MSRRAQQAGTTTKKPRRRKTLALPYSTPPRSGPLHLDPSVHTAAELMAPHRPEHPEHHTAA